MRTITIAVDFDGVVHWFRRGWHDGTIYDPPVPGAVESLHSLMDYAAVFIHTSREPEQVMPWLQRLGFDVTIDERCGRCVTAGYAPNCPSCGGTNMLWFWNVRGQLLVTSRKLPAVAYLDDRAVRFTDWDSAVPLLGEAVSQDTQHRAS